MKKLFFKYKKMIILSIISIIIILILLFIFNNNLCIVLKNKSISLEYGENISTNINDYIDTKKTNEDVLSNVKMNTSKIKMEKNMGYPAIGEYDIIFKYKDNEEILHLKVIDTTKPVFKDFIEEVEFTRDCKPSAEAEEFSKMFSAEDLDSTTISVDDSKVNYFKEGEYTATVKAIDGSKNEVSQDIKVKITAPTIKLDKSKDTVYEGESLVLKADIKGKDTKAVFKSSNTKVATVDENGKVTAKNNGSAVITASANGVEAKFNLTVKAKPKNSSTEKKTVTNPNTGKKEEVTVVVKPSKPSNGGSGSSSSGGSVAMEYSLSKAKEAFNLQNAERAKAGLPALQWNGELYEFAKVRAKEVTVKWSHTRPDGTGVSDYLMNSSFNSLGENLVKGTTSASQAMASWMASPGHKANILNGNKTMGAIAYYGGHWVSLFAN